MKRLLLCDLGALVVVITVCIATDFPVLPGWVIGFVLPFLALLFVFAFFRQSRESRGRRGLGGSGFGGSGLGGSGDGGGGGCGGGGDGG